LRAAIAGSQPPLKRALGESLRPVADEGTCHFGHAQEPLAPDRAAGDGGAVGVLIVGQDQEGWQKRPGSEPVKDRLAVAAMADHRLELGNELSAILGARIGKQRLHCCDKFRSRWVEQEGPGSLRGQGDALGPLDERERKGGQPHGPRPLGDRFRASPVEVGKALDEPCKIPEVTPLDPRQFADEVEAGQHHEPGIGWEGHVHPADPHRLPLAPELLEIERERHLGAGRVPVQIDAEPVRPADKVQLADDPIALRPRPEAPCLEPSNCPPHVTLADEQVQVARRPRGWIAP
jgi:hypothetical protein